MNKKITLFCGVPGVGKDYIAKSMGFNILSYDDIRVEIYRNSAQTLGLVSHLQHIDYNQIYKEAFDYCNREKIDLNGRLVQKAKNTESPIAICNTNLSVKARRSIMNVLKPICYSFDCYYVFSDTNTIMERNQNRDKQIPTDVIHKFMRKQSVPTLAEGFNSVEFIRN